MRRVIARQSKVQSHPLDFIGIPKAVLVGLNTKTDDYGTACRIGAECAADLVAAFQFKSLPHRHEPVISDRSIHRDSRLQLRH